MIVPVDRRSLQARTRRTNDSESDWQQPNDASGKQGIRVAGEVPEK
jgi:hypothetical protein